jgi:peptidoglycan lytic transglycosylase
VSVLPAWYLRHIYPLRYSSEIGAAARRNGLNPALVAAVVYKESGFDAATTSPQGAVGLMQVLPSTAEEIARKSGGREFVLRDLQRPGVNVLYGSYYLRRLLDSYQGSELEAIAAYNAGQTNVDRWAAAARAAGRPFDVRAIPYGETRDYVAEVERLRAIYDRVYGAVLGR